MESMLIAIERGGNIISSVDFSKICQVIKCLPGLKQIFRKEDNKFPLSSSLRAIEWRKIYESIKKVC